ncbi:MAG: hypothetical protein IPL94_09250 [Tetrasphaera sp.]|nr:hypothetical protein [Tetrasphaera sp.]
MGTTASPEPGDGRVRRRALTRAAVWATPVISVAAAAPAIAASFPPGLQGWTQWQRRCGFSTTTLTVDGNGPNNLVYPNDIYGFYVYYATSTTSLTNACMSFSYSPGYPAITWTALTGSGAGWSLPTLVPGTSTYRTCYSGPWTYVAASGSNPAYAITSQIPIFRGTTTISTCYSQAITIVRSVTVNGNVLSFTRTITI